MDNNAQTTITFDLTQIPDYRVAELSETVASATLAYLAQPGIREKYEEWLKKRAATKGGDIKERSGK